MLDRIPVYIFQTAEHDLFTVQTFFQLTIHHIFEPNCFRYREVPALNHNVVYHHSIVGAKTDHADSYFTVNVVSINP